MDSREKRESCSLRSPVQDVLRQVCDVSGYISTREEHCQVVGECVTVVTHQVVIMTPVKLCKICIVTNTLSSRSLKLLHFNFFFTNIAILFDF